eukprot:g6997.t1
MDLARLSNEVSVFLDACPKFTDFTGEDRTQVLLNSISKLRSLIEQNSEIRTRTFQKALELCLYDMVTDGESIDSFVEFGLWILHHCIISEHTLFFENLDEVRVSDFLNEEQFQYSIVRKRNSEVLIRNQERSFCANEWCSQEGVLLCSCCLHFANRRVAYCSRDCQLSHWSSHRKICGRDQDTMSEIAAEDIRTSFDSTKASY